MSYSYWMDLLNPTPGLWTTPTREVKDVVRDLTHESIVRQLTLMKDHKAMKDLIKQYVYSSSEMEFARLWHLERDTRDLKEVNDIVRSMM
jgi:hypothetical protein